MNAARAATCNSAAPTSPARRGSSTGTTTRARPTWPCSPTPCSSSRCWRRSSPRAARSSRSRSRAASSTSTTTIRCCCSAYPGTDGVKTGYTQAAGPLPGRGGAARERLAGRRAAGFGQSRAPRRRSCSTPASPGLHAQLRPRGRCVGAEDFPTKTGGGGKQYHSRAHHPTQEGADVPRYLPDRQAQQGQAHLARRRGLRHGAGLDARRRAIQRSPALRLPGDRRPSCAPTTTRSTTIRRQDLYALRVSDGRQPIHRRRSARPRRAPGHLGARAAPPALGAAAVARAPARPSACTRVRALDAVGTHAVHAIGEHSDATHAEALALIDELLALEPRSVSCDGRTRDAPGHPSPTVRSL